MSVVPNNLVLYGPLNLPEADGTTVGGAIDVSKRFAFSDISTNGTFSIVSTSGGDTSLKCAWAVRDPTGVLVTGVISANGTTPVSGTQQAQRFLYACLSNALTGFPLTNPGGGGASGDVAFYATTAVATGLCQAGSSNTSGTTPPLFHLTSGQGGLISSGAVSGVGYIIWITAGTGVNQLRYITSNNGVYGADLVSVNRDWVTIPASGATYSILQGMLFEQSPYPVTAITRMFATSSSDVPGGSNRNYYEKAFLLNWNPTNAFQGVGISVAYETPSLPSGSSLAISLASGLNDTITITNRQTAPATGTYAQFLVQPAVTGVTANSGNLPPGSNVSGYLGIFFNLALVSGTAPYDGSMDFHASGSTT